MSTHGQSRAGSRGVGLLAGLSILAAVGGLPMALVAVGAVPAALPVTDLDGLATFLSAPDSGALALTAFGVVAWAAWGVLTLSIALEVAARVRDTPVPSLPGLGLPQSLAHSLVGAVVLLVATSPGTAAAAPVSTVAADVLDTVTTTAATQTPSSTRSAGALRPEGPTHSHTVARGESLWSIADTELGDGARWTEIEALNPGRTHGPDHTLWTGTVLRLPSDETVVRNSASHLVRPGESLSSIAQDLLGDSERWPGIYDASTATIQPDGERLQDPDLIRPGWVLTLPSTESRSHGSRRHTQDTSPNPPTAQPTTPDEQPSDTGVADPPSAREAEVTPTASPAPSARMDEPRSAAHDHTSQIGEGTRPPWLLAGLSGGGLLTGSLWILRRRRHAAQARHRRPGRTLTPPPPELVPVEKTLATLGPAQQLDVEALDLLLRHLACSQVDRGATMPALAAVELDSGGTVLHLDSPCELPPPWRDEQGATRWRFPAGLAPADVGDLRPDQPAPYPLLVTVGTSEAGALWLYNLEDLTIALTGDPLYAADYARYLAAEIACNPWSETVRMDCVGIAAEVVALNPDRLRAGPADGTDALQESIAHAVTTADRAQREGLDGATARARVAGPEAWSARLAIVAYDAAPPKDATILSELLQQNTGATATSLVLVGPSCEARSRVSIELTDTGRVLVPGAGLDLVAVGLTPDEAQGCAALLAAGKGLADAPVPTDDTVTDGWRSLTDTAGALRADLVTGREGAEASTVLPDRDASYLEVGAVQPEDLDALAPGVPPETTTRVTEADPDLEDDLAAWFADDCPLPRLTLLGPVRARTRGRALTERKAYMTSVLTFLATRPHGATPEELADTFSVSATKARVYAGIVRDWLGTNPRTGEPHLPDARLAPSAQVRGVPVYEVQDVLVDADLFRRLRARGQARGADGIADLVRALQLVTGEPLSRLRPGAWSWLYDGDRLDQHLTCAVVDVAHLVVTRALQEGDLEVAEEAARIAHLAAPDEHIPLLDLAAAADARGDARTRAAFLSAVVDVGEDEVPPDLPERTDEVLRRRGWTGRGSAAS